MQPNLVTPRQRAAIAQIERGRLVIPVPVQSKQPGRDAWQLERWTIDDVPTVFAGDGNISLLLGPDSAYTADVDSDCPEALMLADAFLTPTGAQFGRPSTPGSHRLYTVAGELKTTKFQDPIASPGERAMLVELRWSGCHTLIPPSHYPEGDPCVWHADGPAAEVEAADLLQQVTRLAGAALLARYWPGEGSRHDAALALAGGLARGGWDEEAIVRFMEPMLSVAGDDELADRIKTIRSSIENQASGRSTTGWTTLGRLLDPRVIAKAREWLTPKRLDEAKGVGGREPAQATILVDLAHEQEMELFHDATGDPFATLFLNGHWETWSLRSKSFRQYLARTYFHARGKAPGSQALKDSIEVLAGEALFAGPERPVEVRLAADDVALYLDLGTRDWQIIRIDSAGWSVIAHETAPVRFRRPTGLLALPLPVRGGSIHLLRPYVNCTDDDEWKLIVGWLIGCLYPHGPRPILQILGEQGSAKSTLARLLRSLVDPNQVPLRSEPKDEGDLLIAAKNGLIVAIDNVSSLKAWLSDAFCRIATGGGISKRELYSDADEVLLDAQRPVIFTGINDVATASDLLDRCLTATLRAIRAEQRRTERELNRAFAVDRPSMLGALLDAASVGLRNLPTTTLSRHPRMADFCLWVEAAAPAFGWDPEEFLDAMEANRRGADAVAIEAVPIGSVLLTFMEARSGWEGTATELLAALSALVSEQVQRSREWPKRANSLSGQLRRLAPNLRQLGITVDGVRSGKAGQRRLSLIKNNALFDRQQRQSEPDVPEPSAHSLTIPGTDGSSADRQPSSAHRQPAREHPAEGPQVVVGADEADDADDASPPLFLMPPSLQTDFGDDMEEVTL
jgi:hypothetical protein